MIARLSQQADEEALCRWLEGIGLGAPVAGIERVRSANSSSYTSEVVTVRLAGGEEFRLFLKDFGHSQFPKDDLARQRDRELRVYRDLLGPAGLGAAKYYGSVWDGSQGRFWLLLEFVEGTPVEYCAFDDWVRAAAWLGRLHGHFAGQADHLGTCDFLLRHDADFFRSQARQALKGVSQCWPSLAGRLAEVLKRFEPCVEVLVSQPLTLVHGSYNSRNILAGARREPASVCPVDWEKAALGSALYDLAFLSYGFEPPRLDRLIGAYRDEALAHGVVLADGGQLRFALNCFRLYRALKTLCRAQSRTLPEPKASRKVEEAERLSALVG